MKYFNTTKKQMLPNKNLDKFLTELHLLCKTHKMTICSLKNAPLVIEIYNKTNAKKMLHNIQDGLAFKKEEDENDQE